jgi:hypothetical protein
MASVFFSGYKPDALGVDGISRSSNNLSPAVSYYAVNTPHLTLFPSSRGSAPLLQMEYGGQGNREEEQVQYTEQLRAGQKPNRKVLQLFEFNGEKGMIVREWTAMWDQRISAHVKDQVTAAKWKKLKQIPLAKPLDDGGVQLKIRLNPIVLRDAEAAAGVAPWGLATAHYNVIFRISGVYVSGDSYGAILQASRVLKVKDIVKGPAFDPSSLVFAALPEELSHLGGDGDVEGGAME